ncbi:MAG TPA: ATP-binding protein [Nevskia sp.]|nr:ATP-binding protein [Nevskia sp.]
MKRASLKQRLQRIASGAGVQRDAAGLQNMMQLIQLRWIAVSGQVLTIVFAQFVLGIELPLRPMLLIVGALVVLNILSYYRWARLRQVSDGELLRRLLLDVAALTALLYLSGGATNPFVFLYPLQVILGAVLLKPRSTWTIVAVTTLCFAGLTLWYEPLRLPHGGVEQLFSLHILGLLICFVLDAGLLVVFMSRINQNLRRRDAWLADLRQRAAEEDHIVRMGLLASGAAHELGTPLASLSVILNDWEDMPVFWQNPELLHEVGDMQAAVERCKAIVSGILLSAGEARGESLAITTVAGFVDALVAEWRTRRNPPRLDYDKDFAEDLPIVSDSALKQIIGNVLDNAYEASPDWVGLSVSHDGETLVLRVRDRGPGFAPEMLAQFGKPYQSSKGRPGGGLGLFLLVNVVRKLGGRVTAENDPQGGAVVTLYLPLVSLAIEEEDERAV